MIAVVLGGTVRIYDAGESCPDWPQCFGTWGFDISEEDQGIWYNETGEYDSDGSAKRYTTGDIFLAWIHRFGTGIILGPLCILQWYLAFKRKESMPSVHTASAVALILVIVQGLMGMLTVRYDNIPWSVAAHLVRMLERTERLRPQRICAAVPEPPAAVGRVPEAGCVPLADGQPTSP